MKAKTTSCKYVISDRSDSDAEVCYWQREGDRREFITDPYGDIVNLARLTAYAEYGEVVYEREIHHEIPIEKPDAPMFLTPVTGEAHGALHGTDPEPREIDGIPRLQPDSV